MAKIIQLKESENNVYPVTRGEVIFSGRTDRDIVCTKKLTNFNCIEIVTASNKTTRFFDISEGMNLLLTNIWINPDPKYMQYVYLQNVKYTVEDNTLKYHYGRNAVFTDKAQPMYWDIEEWNRIPVIKVIGYK